jgi:hypothetical protein
MSKSKWKELPDWTQPEEYDFMDGEPPEVWAWEFLRRNPEYRKQWKQYVHTDSRIYEPPKRADENKAQWMSRVVHELDEDPIDTHLSEVKIVAVGGQIYHYINHYAVSCVTDCLWEINDNNQK